MKTKKLIFAAVSIAMLAFGCTKEPPSIEGFSASVEDTDIDAGQQVIFTINQGDAEFVTFFSGKPGSVYENYPEDNGIQLDLQFSDTYAVTYNEQGQFTATVLAISYGNWAEDVEQTQKTFTINVTDNRTGITSFIVKLGLTAQVKGVIDDNAKTIAVTFPAGTTNLLQRSTLFVLESATASAFDAGGAELESGAKLDFDADFTIRVVAPGGAEQIWTVHPVVAS